MRHILLTSVLLLGLLAQGSASATVVNDPAGDARDSFGAGGVLHDIKALEYKVIGTDLYVSLSFYNAISAPSLGGADLVAGYVEFDTDQNPLTGITPTQNIFGFGNVGLGIDYYVDLFAEFATPGFFDVIEATSDTTVGSVAANFGADYIDFLVPLALLGGDDGSVDGTAIVGTVAQPTDAVRDVPVPVPGTLALFGLLPLLLRATRRS